MSKGRSFNWIFIFLIVLGIVVYKYNKGTNTEHASVKTEYSSLTFTSKQTKEDVKGEIIKGNPNLLECPRLSGGNNNYFITHWANGMVNYSVEYDVSKHCPSWVAFTFNKGNSIKRHRGRSEWHWDIELPPAYDISDLYRNSGYDRGHMVASNDRQSSSEANYETFVYTNVCPQTHSFNAGIWKRLESKVQEWGKDYNKYDTLYVVKGATLENNRIKSYRLGGKIAIPKYFWMALIGKSKDSYHGIGFLLEHKDYSKSNNIKSFAISIDSLEHFIGLDLFHNVPDNIERQVESEDPNSRISRQYWWR